MSTKELVKKFTWKELSGDGLLKEPETIGTYYDEIRLNGYEWFDTKEEAEAALLEFINLDPWFSGDDYVLVEIYNIRSIE
jgi:hypothetical protein